MKVLTMLQQNIRGGIPDEEEEAKDYDEEKPEKPTELYFNAMSKNCSRRTAAGVFFELLQLKTWDFVELDQDEPYGDFAISAGSRFQEAPPNGRD